MNEVVDVGDVPKNDSNAAVEMALLSIFFGALPSSIYWWYYNNKGRFWVVEQSKRMLNFQITLILAAVVGTLLAFIFIGDLILFLIPAANAVFSILAAIRLSKGQVYKYPLTYNFFR